MFSIEIRRNERRSVTLSVTEYTIDIDILSASQTVRSMVSEGSCIVVLLDSLTEKVLVCGAPRAHEVPFIDDRRPKRWAIERPNWDVTTSIEGRYM
jgi:hypothetical protein